MLISLVRIIGFSSSLYLCILLLGLLSREEFKQSNVGVQIALTRANNVVRACEPTEMLAEISHALVVYLAIEEYFRPKVIREIEFFLATVSAYTGFEIVKTIGIGQISMRRFESVNRVVFGVERKYVWISKLREDCENVRLLVEMFRMVGEVCDRVDERYCALRKICLWHTDHLTKCFDNEKHLRYIQSAALWYEVLRNND